MLCGSENAFGALQPRRIASPMAQFQPGKKVELSGVYKAIHHDDHVPSHYVTAIYGDTLPG